MPPMPTRRTTLVTVAAGLLPWPINSSAQPAWPGKPVTLIVPFPAGGGTDTFARPLSAQFSRLSGKPLVIDNRGGAGGTLGASIAAKATPDGYNYFMGGTHHVIAPSMYPKLDYDLEKDFIALTPLATVPQVLVVNPQKIPGDFKAFMAQLRKNPGKLNYGSAGAGSAHHLAGELFKMQTNTFITHIPYRGAGPALQGLISGDVDMVFDGLGSSATHIKGGRIKALMVAGSKRNPAFPDVPCAAELGLPDYTMHTWYGLWAPKGTPPEIQKQMLEHIRQIGLTEEIKTIWAGNGAEFGNQSPEKFSAFVSSEIKRWATVVKASGAKLD